VATAFEQREHFQVGQVFGQAIGVLTRNLPLYLGLSLPLVGLPILLFALAFPAYIGSASPGLDIAYRAALGGFAGLLYLTGTYVLQATVVRATVEDLSGRRARFGDCLATGLRVIFPILGITIVSVVGIMLGFLLLIVPGVMLALAWSVAIAVEVEERGGVFASLRRSRVLTRGSRWRIFGLCILVGLTLTIAQALIAGVFAAFGTTSAAFGQAIAQALSAAGYATAAAVMYIELRRIKEGAGIEALAGIFA
jgi:hypothetical protein